MFGEINNTGFPYCFRTRECYNESHACNNCSVLCYGYSSCNKMDLSCNALSKCNISCLGESGCRDSSIKLLNGSKTTILCGLEDSCYSIDVVVNHSSTMVLNCSSSSQYQHATCSYAYLYVYGTATIYCDFFQSASDDIRAYIYEGGYLDLIFLHNQTVKWYDYPVYIYVYDGGVYSLNDDAINITRVTNFGGVANNSNVSKNSITTIIVVVFGFTSGFFCLIIIIYCKWFEN